MTITGIIESFPICEPPKVQKDKETNDEYAREITAYKWECKILEGHLMADHVHMLISIPPKYSVSQVVGFIKGKSAIWVARNYAGRRKNFTGHKFWARGYYVSTVG